ncbi:MAG: hypothetical protein IT201_14615 [Thermoleophilia bacterium]|nr:hypothetical protein [Thermoleophilia bacterium]
MEREQLISLSSRTADRFRIPRLLMLGCAIAESGLDPSARRPGRPDQDEEYWPDVSFGAWQQTVRWAPEYRGGDDFPGPEEISRVGSLYLDPCHASEVAARNLAAKFHDASPTLDLENLLRDLCEYNWPAGHERAWTPETEANYRRGLAEAALILSGQSVPAETPVPEQPGDRVFNPDQPVERQRLDWTCAIRATTWVLKSVGVSIAAEELHDIMVPGLVNADVGLRDGSGAGIADLLRDRFGLPAANVSPVSWGAVTSMAGTRPIALGGHGWGSSGHWVAVRRFRDGVLELANPATGLTYGGETLSRQQFDERGWWSMVWVDVASPESRVPSPEPVELPPSQEAALIGALAHVCDDLGDELEAIVARLRSIRHQFIGPRPSNAGGER